MKRYNLISWLACIVGIPVLAHAQAVPTASRSGSLQVGAGWSYAKPDYTETAIKGPSFYATFDISQHLGAEAVVHYISITTPDDVGEDSYLIGPRYVFHKGRFMPYAKALVGVGQINFQFDFEPHYKVTKFVYGLGGGLDIRATHSLNVRAFDFEYQQWPAFAPHGLSPYAITIGAAYVFR